MTELPRMPTGTGEIHQWFAQLRQCVQERTVLDHPGYRLERLHGGTRIKFKPALKAVTAQLVSPGAYGHGTIPCYKFFAPNSVPEDDPRYTFDGWREDIDTDMQPLWKVAEVNQMELMILTHSRDDVPFFVEHPEIFDVGGLIGENLGNIYSRIRVENPATISEFHLTHYGFDSQFKKVVTDDGYFWREQNMMLGWSEQRVDANGNPVSSGGTVTTDVSPETFFEPKVFRDEKQPFNAEAALFPITYPGVGVLLVYFGPKDAVFDPNNLTMLGDVAAVFKTTDPAYLTVERIGYILALYNDTHCASELMPMPPENRFRSWSATAEERAILNDGIVTETPPEDVPEEQQGDIRSIWFVRLKTRTRITVSNPHVIFRYRLNGWFPAQLFWTLRPTFQES